MITTCQVLDNSTNSVGLAPFARDVSRGLSRRPKSIPSRYFYDDIGSRLFQRISELPEYYLTRAEREVLRTYAPHAVAGWHARQFRMVELGAGDGQKTSLLLHHYLTAGLRFDYVPIDICQSAMIGLTRTLERHLGDHDLRVEAIVAEYFDALASLDSHAGPTLVLFLGSNIGNFAPREARRLLRRLRSSLRPGDRLLIGFDLKKDPALLVPAYNDAQGVTREFNFNLLQRINRELGGEFDCERFRHYGPYNVARGRMESWLVSLVEQQIAVRELDLVFAFAEGEGIRVERSYKYTIEQIERMARGSGFRVRRHFFDRRGWFADSLWEVA